MQSSTAGLSANELQDILHVEVKHSLLKLYQEKRIDRQKYSGRYVYLIGQFKNNGRSWQRDPLEVKDHDFPTDAIGKAIPYGIFDTIANSGTVCVGTSCDTPRFATESIASWWKTEGQPTYQNAKELLILADSGGSNGYRSRVWKFNLQKKLCNQFGLTVYVSHYPPSSSKWNPIEHRLFSEISKNWQGHPLDSYETILKYIRTTKTNSGLQVKANFVRKKSGPDTPPPERR